MTRYIVFLRAINVGGRVVEMDALKDMFAMRGIKNITTYIQSGNVIFDSAETNKDVLVKKIEKKLLPRWAMRWPRFSLKTIPDLEAVIKNSPFKEYPVGMGLHVSFLSAVPDAEQVKVLLSLQNDNEQFIVSGSEAYILVKEGAYGEDEILRSFPGKKTESASHHPQLGNCRSDAGV